jgi:hypothetical protein
MLPTKNGENGAGVEVDEILNDRARGHGDVHNNHNQNMIDLNGVEIDDIIKYTKRGVRWDDDNNDVVHLPPENDDGDEDVRDVDVSPSACRPWRWMALVVVWSFLAFAALVAVGYGLGYAIKGGGRSSSSSEANVSSSLMEAADAAIPTYSPTYGLAPTPSPMAALRTTEEIVSNDVEPGGILSLDGDGWRGRNRRRTRGLRRNPSKD